MALTNVIGYIAASLVFAAFYAKRMVPLRLLAIASNIGFISYGSLLGLWPIVLLHTGMLPMNILRLHQAFAVPGGSERTYKAVARAFCGLFDVVRRQPTRWAERERIRRELAGMRGRDFGDLAVPLGLIEDEKRRWPWQELSPEWSATAFRGTPSTRHSEVDRPFGYVEKDRIDSKPAFGCGPNARAPKA